MKKRENIDFVFAFVFSTHSVLIAPYFLIQLARSWPLIAINPDWGVFFSIVLVSSSYYFTLKWIYRNLYDSPNNIQKIFWLYAVVSIGLCFALFLEVNIDKFAIPDSDSQMLRQILSKVTAGNERQPGGDSSQSLTEKSGLLQDFYFTVMTFTTVGYGDYTPAPGCGQIFACFIALLGTTHSVFFITLVLKALEGRAKEDNFSSQIKAPALSYRSQKIYKPLIIIFAGLILFEVLSKILFRISSDSTKK